MPGDEESDNGKHGQHGQHGQHGKSEGAGEGADSPRPAFSDRRRRFQEMPSPLPEREWSTVAHCGILAGIILPFGAIIPALFVLVVKRSDPFVRTNAQEAINLGINYTIVQLGLLMLSGLLPTVVGILASLALIIPVMTMAVVGGVRSYRGEPSRYPVPLRLLRRGS